MAGSNAIRVLVVDDDPSLIDEYRRILSAGEASPSEADSLLSGLGDDLFGAAIKHKQFPAVDLAEFRLGQDAVEAVRKGHENGRPFAIAFVDMQLNSGLNGVETAERIRAVDARIQIAVMAGSSALHPVELVARVPPADRLSFVKMPFHPFEVQHLLLGCVHRQRVEMRGPEPQPADDGDHNRSILRVILDRLPVGILVFDRRDRLVMANAEMSRQFADLANLFVPGVRYNEIYREFNTENTPKRGVLGNQKVWQLWGSRWAVVMEEVAPTGETYCIFYDVTDLKSHDVVHWRSTFLIHLTQVFSTLCCTIDELLADMAGDAHGAEQSVARLRAVAKQRHLTPHAVGLSQFLARAMRRIRRRLPAGIGLEAVLDAGLWPVEIDVDGLARTLAELTANACEAMPNGGRIIVEVTNVRLTPGSALVRSGLEAGDYVRLSIQDTGKGMVPGCVDRAIIPFQSRKEGQYLGLGLTIVHAFAIGSGGWLDVDGGAGSGATIHLYLPKAVRADASKKSTLKAESKLGAISVMPAKKPIRGPSRTGRGAASLSQPIQAIAHD